jgi:alpha-1,3-mannosyltransferase
MVVHYYKQLALSTRMDAIWIAALLLFELLLGIVIIHKVPYTEIDWIAYMQEVSGWYDGNNGHGEYDYRNLRGDTGPLVYPAGSIPRHSSG